MYYVVEAAMITLRRLADNSDHSLAFSLPPSFPQYRLLAQILDDDLCVMRVLPHWSISELMKGINIVPSTTAH